MIEVNVNLIVIALIAVALLVAYLVWYIQKTQKDIYRRVLISNLGKRFPEFYDEITDDLADLMLKAREKHDAAWQEKRKNSNAVVEDDTPLFKFIESHISKEFREHIESNKRNDEIIRVAIFDSLLISGNAKLRAWVDQNGKEHSNMDGERPPAWW